MVGIKIKNILIVVLKSLFVKFFFDKNGNKKALKPFDKILNLPVNCWGIEYVANAIGPRNI